MSERSRNNEHSDSESYEADYRPRRFRKRWIFALFFVLLLLLLPKIVSLTPLGTWALASATADVNGTVNVNNMSLGWFSSTRLGGIQIDDVNGNTAITADQAIMNKSLIGLLTSSDYGTLQIDRPIVNATIRSDGSNIEDIFANYIKPNEDKQETPKPIRVVIKDGTINASQQLNSSTSALTGVNADIQYAQQDAALRFTATAITEDETKNTIGNLQVEGTIDPGTRQLSLTEGSCVVTVQNAAIQMIGPVLNRLGYEVSTTGIANGQTKMDWTQSFEEISIDLQDIRIDQTQIDAPNYLNREILAIASTRANGRLTIRNQNMFASNLSCDCDLGRLTANGEFSFSDLAGIINSQTLSSKDFDVNGVVDLAKVARVLPNTTGLHRDVKIQSGVLNFQAFSRMEGANRRMLVNAETQKIFGERNGQSFQWQQPLRATLALRQSPTSTILEQLKLETNGISITGKGSSRQADIQARGDLSIFANELSQFFDLSRWKLAGRFAGQMRWIPSKNAPVEDLIQQPMDLQASIRFVDADVSIPAWGNFRERQFDVQIHARGSLNQDNSIRIETGTGIVSSGNDRLKFTLGQPIQNAGFNSTIVGHLDLAGNAKSWHARLDPFLPGWINDMQVHGETKFAGDVALNKNGLRLRNGNYHFDRFAFNGFGLQIDEPRVTGQAQCDIDFAKQEISVAGATLAATSIAARATNTHINYGKNWKLLGNIDFRADVRRTSQWVPALAKSTMQYYGLAQGNARIESGQGKYLGTIKTNIDNLRIMQAAHSPRRDIATLPVGHRAIPSKLLWQEQRAVVDSTFVTADFDRFDFEKLQVTSKALSLAARGNVSDFAGQMQTNLAGTWSPNWQAISSILQGLTRQKVAFSGQTTENFRISGPIFVDPKNKSANGPWFSPQLKAQTSIAWQQANVVGFPVGPAKVNLDLQNNNLSLGRNQIRLSSGYLDAAPGLDLRTSQPVFYLREGSSLNQLQLSPEFCRSWLKYIAPPIADATRAQGTFSVSTKTVQLPVFKPTAGSAEGVLTIEKATIGSGPLTDQILSLAKTIKQITSGGNIVNSLLTGGGGLLGGNANNPNTNTTWVVMPKQQIPFRMSQGRVYHQGVTFQIDDVTVQTNGSVGFDQSIQMVATIPVLDQWIEKKPWLASMKGRSIQVPISGTVSRPIIDQRVLRQLTTQFLQQNAGQAIGNQINDRVEQELTKGLKNLFGK